jgi:hypothetical protein
MKGQAYRMSCSLNTNAYTRLSGGTIGGVINIRCCTLFIVTLGQFSLFHPKDNV